MVLLGALEPEWVYTYNLRKQLTFDIQNVFADGRQPGRLIESHITAILSVIHKLSQQQGWYPECQSINTMNGRATILIPIPDHVILQ